MKQLLGILGSLRADSVNTAVARAAVDLTGDASDATLTLHSLADVPLYNGDIEAAGLPSAVVALQEAVGAADGVIFFSPEYNGSFPAVTKNAIDWLSRPPKQWEDTAITMVTATPGPRAGVGVRDHFSAIMPFQPTRLFGETFGIGSYPDKMEDGKLADAQTRTDLGAFLQRFSHFA